MFATDKVSLQSVCHSSAELTKIRKVNMGTMVKINDLFAQAGGKALTVMKLKELGSKAERKAWRLYNALRTVASHPTYRIQ